ncbi:MAG: septum formation initiator family protein [Actinomycetaceae bacterium]|nr:septum formation initiator family protein [Arcanobacterium sp.]MDD7505839.1 septum formation initiator family protein [Actinomycetaceae bacterium]
MNQRRPNTPRTARPGGARSSRAAASRMYPSPARSGDNTAGRQGVPNPQGQHGSRGEDIPRTSANGARRLGASGTGSGRRRQSPRAVRKRTPRFALWGRMRAYVRRRKRYFAEGTRLSYAAGNATRTISVRTVAVLAFLALAVVMVASPLKNYLVQQEEKRELLAQLEDSRTHIEQLEQELALWKDPVFVQSQARKRLGYVMPGQTLYLLDDGALGEVKGTPKQLAQKALDERRAATPFYLTAWDSIVVTSKATQVLNNPEQVPVLNAPESGTSEPADLEADTPDGDTRAATGAESDAAESDASEARSN